MRGKAEWIFLRAQKTGAARVTGLKPKKRAEIFRRGDAESYFIRGTDAIVSGKEPGDTAQRDRV